MKGRKLTERQRLFVEEFVVRWPFLNATLAAREAGYSQLNPDVAAAKQIAKPHVRAAIDRRLNARRKRLEAAQRARDEIAEKASRCRELVAAGYTLEEAASVSGYEPFAGHGRKPLAEVQEMISRATLPLNARKGPPGATRSGG